MGGLVDSCGGVPKWPTATEGRLARVNMGHVDQGYIWWRIDLQWT